MKKFPYFVATLLILLLGCGESNPTAPEPPAVAPQDTSTVPAPPLSVALSPTAINGRAVPQMLIRGCTITGGTQPYTARYLLLRYDKAWASGEGAGYSGILKVPGRYLELVFVSDSQGRNASAERFFSLKHSWWYRVPWNDYYATAIGSRLTVSGVIVTCADDAFTLLEYQHQVYAWLYHDWCVAEFADGFMIYNRPKKIRFRNHMAEILYAVFVNGDADWWSGTMSSNGHWNLAAGSSDRAYLFRTHGKIISVQRIDHPPVNPGDPIAY